LPDDLNQRVTTRLHFADPPATHLGQPVSDTSIEALAQHYVGYLRSLLERAGQQFGA